MKKLDKTKSKKNPVEQKAIQAGDGPQEAIAIIGIGGFLPGADSIDDFCQKLTDQQSLFSMVPDSHFPTQEIRERYGAFLKDVAGFDAEIFSIGPMEAEYMDPRTRKLLMSVWHTLEDACYLPAQLEDAKVNTYIASEGAAYSPFLARAELSSYSTLGMMAWALPNYISHAFKFKGKSLYLDTACSGGSTALHEAKQALLRNECDYAIAGASNLLFGDALAGSYVGQEALGILGKATSCYPFQAQATGFLPAEANVTVLLKKLSRAVADKDNIHGVILGSDVCHNGGYGSLTMPSAQAQANAIVNAYKDACIHPDTVTYIEAHAASSLLADSEEIKGFKLADSMFKQDFEFRGENTCKLSTLKPNIGHANSASGMVSLIRVLHALKSKTKLGIKGFSETSDKIKLNNTRFYLDALSQDWPTLLDNSGKEIPRRAAINNFGAGGVNVHLVLEEFERPKPQVDKVPGDGGVYFLGLSTMHEWQWIDYATSILNYLENDVDIAPEALECLYLSGRRHFSQRLVFRYTSIDNLITKLKQFIQHKGKKAYYLKSEQESKGKSLDIFTRHTRLADFIKTLDQETDKKILMELWVKGVNLPFDQMLNLSVYTKRSLPGYPFNIQEYWSENATTHMPKQKGNLSHLHPLVHRNNSDFYVQKYTSVFTGDEFFLEQHLVQGRKVLPGVAYLELARAAIAYASGNKQSIGLKNISWVQPIVVADEAVEIHITLKPLDIHRISFDIYSMDNREKKILHCQGQGLLIESPLQVWEALDLETIRRECNLREINAEECYRTYAAAGIEHGPVYRGVETIFEGQNQAIAKVISPTSPTLQGDVMLLHPGLLDSVLQMAAGFMVDPTNPKFALPFALESLEIQHQYEQLPENIWVWARYKKGSSPTDNVKKIDYDVCDEHGKVWLKLSGFSSRTIEASTPKTAETVKAIHDEVSQTSQALASDSVKLNLITAIQKSLARLRKLDPLQINLQSEFSSFGFDSIQLTELTNQLNRKFGLELVPTVFFEHPSLGEFIDYLLAEYRDVFTPYFNVSQTVLIDENENGTDESVNANITSAATAVENELELPMRFNIDASHTKKSSEPIAIVGMSGRFPMSKDLDAFWDNLVNGRDCISEIPQSRWRWQDVYGDPVREVNKSNVKWGGFIEGIDEFDPLFFGISPKEAELMDPQQRLLMTYVWAAMEDAGYSSATLSGTATALFAGTGMSGYSSLIAEARMPIEGYSLTGIVPSVGPNRMSFFLNIHGPSEPVETACSSSLIAIHRGIQAIEGGDCEQAIVGGVNTLVTPDGYISFSKAGMLCEDGRCKTFSSGANGYVRGEGVGMLFIKKLSAAEASGDHIYGLVRASAENHGGKANSLTAPNPKAQTALLKHAYIKADIDPRSVGYIEAHGTGTPLGDPIEINGLKNAFGDLYRKVPAHTDISASKAHCGIGSVKSNIGHLEMAAGVAGVIKVLLQIKHKTLVKSLHSEDINPYIKLDDSPFYVVQEMRTWQAPIDEQGRHLPRRAGISSFGFGGANAHVVIEEYLAPQGTVASHEKTPVMFILSAKNQIRLKEAASNLHDYLQADHSQEPDLNALAYTLQIGRDEMDERLGVLVSSCCELAEKLQDFLTGKEVDNLYQGNVKKSQDTLAVLTADEDIASTLGLWLSKGKFDKILNLWVKGVSFDWRLLYKDNQPQRVSLPTYPFARDRYWIDNPKHSAMMLNEHTPLTAHTKSNVATTFTKGQVVPITEHQVMPEVRDNYTYMPIWEESKHASGQLSQIGGKALVVSCNQPSAFEQALIDKLENRGQRVYRVSLLANERLDNASQFGHQEESNHWFCGIESDVALAQCLEKIGFVEQIYFLTQFDANNEYLSCELITNGIMSNEMQLMRLLKLLHKTLDKTHALDFTLLNLDKHPSTAKSVNFTGAGTSGLVYSLAQGDHRFNVRNLDLSRRDLNGEAKQDKLIQHILSEPASDRGELIRLRNGRRYQQTFFKVDNDSFNCPKGFKQGGVYIILGGSGTVGGVLTRQLIQQYQARVVWLGRQPESSEHIQARLKAVSSHGLTPMYIQADARKPESLTVAVDKIKQQYGRINGAVFAGLVFNPANAINQTTEQDFLDILEVKALGSFNLYHALANEPLDFLVYFSSSQAFSFSGAATLSAYAAGITFSDTLIRSLQPEANFPIGIINWGFWQESLNGLPASQSVHGLSDSDGFACFERFTSALQQALLNHALCLDASGPVKQLMRLNKDETLFLCHQGSANEKLINE